MGTIWERRKVVHYGMVMLTLRIQLLGDFLLVVDEKPVTTISVPRLQSLLGYLMLHRDAPQDRSHLAFLLWPDSTESQAHTNLRKLLHHLRQAFPAADRFLSIGRHSVQWLPAQADSIFTLDVQELEQALIQAEQASDSTTQRQALEQVLRLYRGDLLPNCYDEWVAPERDHWRQKFIQAAERLLALLEEERDYAAAITASQQLLRCDPLHEATYRQLMRLYALQGDRVAALRVYHTCAQLLERELGVGPGEITQAAYETLVSSDSSPSPSTDRPAQQSTVVPLLFRNAEWRLLLETWRKVASGSPHCVLITGEAGIGKTRLAEELEAWVSRQSMTTVSARCYSAVGALAYAPLISWLRSDAVSSRLAMLDSLWLTELARLVPEVLQDQPDVPRPAPITESWQQQRFFEALARALLVVRQPLLCVLDDAQWCDQETLHWLHYLLRFASDARLLLLVTVRSEEVLAGHPLLDLLAALQRDGLMTEIALKPFSASETATLAEQMLGQQLTSREREQLVTETEGNPLFITELVRAGTWQHAGSVLSASEHALSLLTRTASDLPPTLHSVLMVRLAQLSPQTRSLAQVAAVIGRAFAFSVLVHASGEPEEVVVRGLDELWQRRIVREQDIGSVESYDFSHGKLREQAYASLRPAQRRLWHRRVAEALCALSADTLDAVSGQIAAHYEQAGLPHDAVLFYEQAGEAACRIYANTEAIRAFERAVAVIEAPGWRHEVPWERAAQVYISLGDIKAEIGFYEEARHAYQCAMGVVPLDAQIWCARLHWKIAKTWIYASTKNYDAFYAHACEEFETAERLLTLVADPTSPAWRDEWIALQFAQIWPVKGTADDMAAAIDKARSIVEQYGTQEQRRLLAEAIGIHNAIRDRYIISAERVGAWRESIAALEPTENESQRGINLAVFGIGLLCAAQFDEAEEQLRNALQVGERTGNAWLQYTCLTFLPFVFRYRGQTGLMREMLARAQALGIAQDNSILIGQQAWLAWREGDLEQAERLGRESVEKKYYRPKRYNPFQWVGLWPLIGVALTQGRIAAAIEAVRMLFDPTLQPPVAPLDTHLEAVLHAWDAGQHEEAHALLQQAVPLAEQKGYL
jgi:DNA-binding SARP family transcriptional activator